MTHFDVLGFPVHSVVKNPPANARDTGDTSLILTDPWVRNILWRRKWQPTPVFLPGESQGQRNLAGYSPWGHRVRHDWSNLAHDNLIAITLIMTFSEPEKEEHCLLSNNGNHGRWREGELGSNPGSGTCCLWGYGKVTYYLWTTTSLQNEMLFLKTLWRNQWNNACEACHTVSSPARTLENWQQLFLIIAWQCLDAIGLGGLLTSSALALVSWSHSSGNSRFASTKSQIITRLGSSETLTNSQNRKVKFQTPRFPEILNSIWKRSNVVENDEKDLDETCRNRELQPAGATQDVNTWANAQIINRVQRILDEWGSPGPQPWERAPP